MAKVANLMANHNGNPTAVASLYDEKISEVEIEDTDTKIFVHFDSDGSIVDECGNSWLSYQYTTGSNTGATVATVITSDNVYNGFNYGASFSGNKIYIRRESNTSALNNWCNKDYTVEFWACVDSDTFENNDTGIFYLGGSWGYSAGRAKNSAINYYYQYSKTTGVYQLKIIWVGVSARAYDVSPEILLSPFHFACVFNKSTGYASVFLNGILLGSDDSRFYDNSNFNIYSVIIGAMAAQDPYASNFFKGVISGFRYSEKLLYTKTFTPQNPISLSLKTALPVKGNLCVRALTPIAKNTKIFMPFNDPDKPMKDVCGNSWAVSKALTITEDNSQFGKCAYFDGSTWFQSNNAFPLFGQDFTISFWALPIAHSTPSSIGVITLCPSKRKSANRIQFEHVKNTTVLGMYIENIGGLNFSMFTAAYNTDQMNHYAVTYVHETGTWYGFLNGVLKGTRTNAKLSRQNLYVIGGVHSYFDSWFQGYLEDVVIIDGTALWTSDFTPPDKPYSMTQTLYAPLIMQNSPAVDAQTKALLHFDDPDNPLKDECGNQWVEGDYLAQTSSGNIGGAVYSTRTGANSSTVYILGTRYFYLGGQDYTVDFWGKGRVNLRILGTEGWPVVLYPKGFEYPKNGVWTTNNVFSGDSNSWRHYAVVYNYSANTLSFYENGVKKGTVTPNKLERQSRPMLLGYNINTSYPAYYSEFRIVDGLQVWTSNFTPPDAPYTIETYNGKNPPCIGVRRDGNNFYTV